MAQGKSHQSSEALTEFLNTIKNLDSEENQSVCIGNAFAFHLSVIVYQLISEQSERLLIIITIILPHFINNRDLVKSFLIQKVDRLLDGHIGMDCQRCIQIQCTHPQVTPPGGKKEQYYSSD